MYSMMLLVPDRQSGFVLMINGDGDRARTVLGEVLLKLFAAPDKSLGVAGYADELAKPAASAASTTKPALPDVVARKPVPAAKLREWLGTWRDPWFGEVRLCAAGDGVEWRSLKSPKMHGTIGERDGRYVLHWDDVAVDENAWLDFSGTGDVRRLRMAKLDPAGDFSSDYEHLSFTRVGDCAPVAQPPRLSPATTMDAAGMVDIRQLVPDIAQDIKYAGSGNFVGAPVDGYEAPHCYLKREVAEALARVERSLRARHQRLRIYDCYRPARAVAHFMRWAADPADLKTKAAHYPDLDKPQLLGEYIAPVSGHSRGATLDLTLLQCAVTGADCRALDMGTDFDFFGTRANTDSPEATDAQRANRYLLRDAMAAQGFRNYPMEWWHYSFQPEPTPGALYDVPVTAPEQPVPHARIDPPRQR
jgi:D-alanyl-D-alanine dipeptidase